MQRIVSVLTIMSSTKSFLISVGTQAGVDFMHSLQVLFRIVDGSNRQIFNCSQGSRLIDGLILLVLVFLSLQKHDVNVASCGKFLL